MKLLLDTHILLWAAAGTLPRKAVEIVADERNVLLFSSASIWEVVIKNGLGRPSFQIDARMLYNGLLDNGYTEVSVNGLHSLMTGNLPSIHKDPFDRILVAQALHEKATLVTCDKILTGYPCQVIYIKPQGRGS